MFKNLHVVIIVKSCGFADFCLELCMCIVNFPHKTISLLFQIQIKCKCQRFFYMWQVVNSTADVIFLIFTTSILQKGNIFFSNKFDDAFLILKTFSTTCNSIVNSNFCLRSIHGYSYLNQKFIYQDNLGGGGVMLSFFFIRQVVGMTVSGVLNEMPCLKESCLEYDSSTPSGLKHSSYFIL